MKKTLGLWMIWALANALFFRVAFAAEAPAAVKALMPKGAISLQAQSFSTPSGETLVHLYTIPAGHSPAVEATTGEKRTGPVRREHITTGPSINPSRFWVDILMRRSGQWKRVNVVPFIEDKDANEIQLRWLKPAKKQGPMLLMNFGFMHWYKWVLIIFPKGFANPATVQEFYWGGEGATGLMQKFERTDKNGYLMVDEEQSDEKGTIKRVYKWDGVEFADPWSPYFVIGAAMKTRAAAEAFVAQYKTGFVRPASHYKRLTPGVWNVILSRHALPQEAEEMAASLRKEKKISVYVKRAF